MGKNCNNHHHPHHKHDQTHETLELKSPLADEKLRQNEGRTLIVIIITFIMMVVEIIVGNMTGSMALTADGWHMASHAGALGISYLAYRLHRAPKIKHHFSFGPGKFIPLGGYTSAVCLGLVALFMAYESILRLLNPVSIAYNEAIIVAVIGLIVNFVCALILKDDHHHGHDHDHHHKHEDHNLKSAYMHVVADALTSIFAIFALIAGKYWNLGWMDAMMGIVGGAVIMKWAWGLCKETAFELLDGHAKAVSHQKVRESFINDAEIIKLHIWKIAPETLACEIVVKSKALRGPEYYRKHLSEKFSFKHIIVEEHLE